MAKFIIKQGAHYHGMPPISTLPWVGEKTMARRVTFSDSCRYDSAAYNSQDVNKLFGLSFGFGGVHGNSARFGWRWSMADQCIELVAYVYLDGVRNQDAQLRFPVVAQVQLGQRVNCRVRFLGGSFYFSCTTEDGGLLGTAEVLAPDTMPGFGLTHGLYFGGSTAAPHTMAVQIDRT